MSAPDNANHPIVARAVALGCAAPAFNLARWPELAQCWLDRAEWLIARHAEITAAERARAIRKCDIYSGAPLPQSYFRTIRPRRAR